MLTKQRFVISVAETWKALALNRVCLVIRATLQAKLCVQNSQPLTQNEEYTFQNTVRYIYIYIYIYISGVGLK